MGEQGYNGYFNYETWNVCLWCDNEYGIYVMQQEQAPFTAAEAEEFVREIFPEGTPDMQTAPVSSYDDVDWQEVAMNFNGDEDTDTVVTCPDCDAQGNPNESSCLCE